MKKLHAVWPKQQAITVGNLLTFRAEVELLSNLKNCSEAWIYFEGIYPEIKEQLSYFEPLLFSGLMPVHAVFGSPVGQEIDWPPQDPEVEKWSYGSFKRVALLCQKERLFPHLYWAPQVLKEAKTLYERFSRNRKRKVVAVHLKRQAGGSEESNAELAEWVQLFSEHKDKAFFLLGKDRFPPESISDNLFIASYLGVDLAVQLAFCSLCNGFLGMAAGISTAACLSLTPYVIFKHPLHHVEEMKLELGDGDCLPFALPSQKLWRKRGSIENLRLGMEILKL